MQNANFAQRIAQLYGFLLQTSRVGAQTVRTLPDTPHLLKASSVVIRCVFPEEAPQAQAALCQGFSEPGVTLPRLRMQRCSIWAGLRQGVQCLPSQRHGICLCRDPVCPICAFTEINKINKFLPSSPRRLTSSWDNSLCCFSASSLCRRKNKQTQTLVTSDLDRAPSNNQLRCALQQNKRQEQEAKTWIT